MSKMDACIQQFFYTDRAHNFPLVKTRIFPGIPRNTGLSLMLLWPRLRCASARKPHSHERDQGRFLFPAWISRREKERQNSKEPPRDNLYFEPARADWDNSISR
jgi:hypothetical protein